MNANSLVRHDTQELAARPVGRSQLVFSPRVDIVEQENELTLFADLPGVAPEALDVRFENGELTIHGKCPPRQQGVEFLACEYGVGDFYRTFTVSEAIDAANISAALRNGVLTVRLPKAEAARPRRIAVRAE